MTEPLVDGTPMDLVGWWRIAEMQLWDADAIDLVAPAAAVPLDLPAMISRSAGR